MPPPSPLLGLHIVGVHEHVATPAPTPERPFPPPLRRAMAVAAATAAAVGAAVVVGEGGPADPIVAAVVLAVLALLDVGDAGRVLQAAAPGRRVRRDVTRIGVAAIVLAAAAQIVGAGLTPLDSVAVAALGLLAAAVVGGVVDRFTRPPERVLVVGTGVVARHLAASLSRGGRARVIGHLDDGRLPPNDADGGVSTVGDVREVAALVDRHDIDLVVFTFVGTDDDQIWGSAAAARSAGARVAVVSRLFEGLRGDIDLARIEGFPVVAAAGVRPGRLAAAALRLTDAVASALLILVTAPLWAVVAIAIVAESRGGVFYRAPRVGRDGVPFRMLKFRKMRADATGPALTMGDDERFTRMGRFLAHSKLDELPQLWNVLIGQMSLVGPRPEDPRYVAAEAEEFAKVLTVRPGITGLSQIGFRREFEHFVGADFEEHYVHDLLPWKLAIDRYYVDHRSWWMDMRILWWTIRALTAGGELDVDSLAPHVAFRPRRGQEAPAA